MAYALLIIEPVGQRRTRTESEGRELYNSMLRFGADLKTRGLLTFSQSLKTDARVARVYVRDRQTDCGRWSLYECRADGAGSRRLAITT